MLSWFSTKARDDEEIYEEEDEELYEDEDNLSVVIQEFYTNQSMTLGLVTGFVKYSLLGI